jgi:hypothetical protein
MVGVPLWRDGSDNSSSCDSRGHSSCIVVSFKRKGIITWVDAEININFH